MISSCTCFVDSRKLFKLDRHNNETKLKWSHDWIKCSISRRPRRRLPVLPYAMLPRSLFRKKSQLAATRVIYDLIRVTQGPLSISSSWSFSRKIGDESNVQMCVGVSSGFLRVWPFPYLAKKMRISRIVTCGWLLCLQRDVCKGRGCNLIS